MELFLRYSIHFQQVVGHSGGSLNPMPVLKGDMIGYCQAANLLMRGITEYIGILLRVTDTDIEFVFNLAVILKKLSVKKQLTLDFL